MNTISKICIAALAVVPAFAAQAEVLSENPLTIPAIAVTPGEETDIVMDYSTTESYCGLQFELTLPEGVSFVMDPYDESEPDFATVNTALGRTHSVTAYISGGVYRAVCVSLSNRIINSPGWLIKVPIKISDDFKGSAQGTLAGCRYSYRVDGQPDREDRYDTPQYFDIYVAPTALRLSETSFYLQKGYDYQLHATYEPAAAAERPLVWTSSDPAVATVDSTGTVKALEPGTATITAALADDATVAASATVTVGTATGIEGVLAAGERATVYDIHGHVLKHNATGADLSALAHGVYIVTSTSKTIKIIK